MSHTKGNGLVIMFKNKLKKSILFIVILLLYICPIVCIVFISQKEKNEYREDEVILTEKAYGEVHQVERSDVEDNIVVDAIGNSYELVNIMENEECSWLVYEGEEIFKDQVIGYRNEKEIVSKYNGIIKDIQDNYVLIIHLKHIKYETEVLTTQVDYFKQNLVDENGNKVKDITISNQIIDGKVKVSFTIEKRTVAYGEKIEGLTLYTGKEYKNVLVLNKSCIYEGEDGQNYVRILDKEGNYQTEQAVNIGYENGECVCVDGLDEGTYCDGGYATFQDITSESED